MKSRDLIRFKQLAFFTILEVDRKLTLYEKTLWVMSWRDFFQNLSVSWQRKNEFNMHHKNGDKTGWILEFVIFSAFTLNMIELTRVLVHRESVRNEFLEERRKDADRLREKYPDKVPVIVQVAKSSEIPQTRKPKYLMPKSISIGKVQTILRDYLKDQDVSFDCTSGCASDTTSGLNFRSKLLAPKYFFSLMNQKHCLYLSRM